MKHIRVNTSAPAGIVSPWLRGACMEDVNHELYGGIWSQMIFGEWFSEDADRGIDTEVLTLLGNSWDLCGQTVLCQREGGGPKLIFKKTSMADSTVSAKIRLQDNGLAGFVCRVSDAKPGADAFNGYEIAVGAGIVRLARHRFNYVNLADVPADVKAGDTVLLSASLTGNVITVSVDGKEVIRFTDDDPVLSGQLGLRCWGTAAEFSEITLDGNPVDIPAKKNLPKISGMWLATDPNPDLYALGEGMKGPHSQILTAPAGVYNRGLNKSGMYFAKDKPYRGYLYLCADSPAEVTAVLGNSDCTAYHASKTFTVSGGWKKYEFTLTSPNEEIDGSFGILVNSGKVSVGYAFLEPDEWGLYKGMHVRRDVGEGLENMGISILRFGGCMANAKEYFWKEMLGESEDRRPYRGFWYPHSSYGFGILEFIELCEKLNVECVPDFNGYETEEDMRDFARYALGTDESDPWVQRRLASRHPEPYRLKFIQYGNEEKVNEEFADRFIAACRGVWSVAPEIIMVVGDYEFKKIIEDPYNLPENCSATRITTLNPHRRMMEYAKECGGTICIDSHWWCEHGSSPLPCPKAAWSLYENLHKMVPGTDTRLCVYELNANAHDFERAMANTYAIYEAVNHSEMLPYMCSANCLQVDKHNDNNWNQGLLFMNNRSVWYQAPGLINKLLEMAWGNQRYSFNEDVIDENFNAAVMTDGEKISVCLLNRSDKAEEVTVELSCLDGKTVPCALRVFSYPKNTVNTADEPEKITLPDPVTVEADGVLKLTLPADSIVTAIF